MSQQHTFFLFILCAFLFSLILSGCTDQQLVLHGEPEHPTSCFSQGWPHDSSDLKPDPDLIFGTLDNGFRYVIMPNQEPQDRLAMYLDIQAGSLFETDAQRGVAHYLEHMLFNGTTHYPPGTLVEYFQSIGMGFGADTNAHTSYDETVYKLLLPATDQKTINDGMVVLADYARGALLLEEEVERERGVILAEKRSRNSAGRRVFKARLKFSFDGSLLAQRDTIGTDEVLHSADSSLLKQFYDDWYRPDTMILVVVGDAKPEIVEESVKKHFAALAAAGERPECPDFGQVAETGTDALYLHEPDLGYTTVAVESVWNVEPQPDSKKYELHLLKEYLASKMLNHRLQTLLAVQGSPMTMAQFYSGRLVQRLGYSSIDARCTDKNWPQTLELLESTLRQTLTFGFSAIELERVKKEALTMLMKQVQVADTRLSRKLATQLINALNSNEVKMSPRQELDLYGPAITQITLADVNTAFQKMWHERRLIKVMGTAELENDPAPKQIILTAYQEAQKKDVQAWKQEATGVFPYLPIPELNAPVAEQIEQHIPYAKIGVDRYQFSNGLILNLKKTDFQDNELQVAAILGHGKLSAPAPGLAMLANNLLMESGLGGLTKEQLAAALAPYSSRVKFIVGQDHFKFTGKGLSRESELLFQLLATHIQDPAFRADVFARNTDKLDQFYKQLQSSVQGVMRLSGERFLAGGNLRYGMVPQAVVKRITLDNIRDWLAPILKDGPMEISVVGDFDQEEILQLTARYFGGPRRDSINEAKNKRIFFPSGQDLTLKVQSDTDKASLIVAWPTDDFWNISQTRRLNVLASVLNDRMRVQIREAMGASYSMYAYNRSSRVDPGYGVLRSGLVVDPDQAEMLVKKLKEIGTELAATGVNEEELERAVEPTLTSIRDMVRNNNYWLNSVLVQSSRHPEQLEWPLTLEEDFASITAEELSALAKQYLQPDKSAEIILIPEKHK